MSCAPRATPEVADAFGATLAAAGVDVVEVDLDAVLRGGRAAVRRGARRRAPRRGRRVRRRPPRRGRPDRGRDHHRGRRRCRPTDLAADHGSPGRAASTGGRRVGSGRRRRRAHRALPPHAWPRSPPIPSASTPALGRFTNGANLVDWCAAAVPVGDDGVGPARSASPCWARRGRTGPCGTAAAHLAGQPAPAATSDPDDVLLAVCGAHLEGQPLHHQLQRARRPARRPHRDRALLPACAALATEPPKPGLVRVPSGGAAPRGRGLGPRRRGPSAPSWPRSRLRWSSAPWSWPTAPCVKGFLCEPHAIEQGATSPTPAGGGHGSRPVSDRSRSLEPGSFTTVQDHPGRLGYWMVGVPPSGPMDDLLVPAGQPSRRQRRRRGRPRVHRHRARPCGSPSPTVVCLGGADMGADARRPPGAALAALRGRRRAGAAPRSPGRAPGCAPTSRCGAGSTCPMVLGSRSTFTLGGFGGHEGRTLAGRRRAARRRRRHRAATVAGAARAAGPRIDPALAHRRARGPARARPSSSPPTTSTPSSPPPGGSRSTAPAPGCASTGPGRPGPAPTAARPACTRRTSTTPATPSARVDFTGDTPVVLGPDGPSLGGFTCPATVVAAERWKLGQLAPGDHGARSCPSRPDRAAELERRQAARGPPPCASAPAPRPLLSAHARPRVRGPRPARPATGDRPDAHHPALRRRLRARRVRRRWRSTSPCGRGSTPSMRWLADARVGDAVVDVTPGVRIAARPGRPDRPSTVTEVAELLQKGDDELPPTDGAGDRRPHRPPPAVVGGPGDPRGDPSLHGGRARRRALVPVQPRVHPPDQRARHRSTTCTGSCSTRRYLVLGLGDVYLGAPVATPLDPRHRLVTTKYNPARTWTPENAVGIGGAYLCVYGMEGPGGYQFVGSHRARSGTSTCRRRATSPTSRGSCGPFDQIRFHPVERRRAARPAGPGPGRRARPRDRADDVPPRPTTSPSSTPRPTASPRSAPTSRPPSRPSATAGAAPASSERAQRSPAGGAAPRPGTAGTVRVGEQRAEGDLGDVVGQLLGGCSRAAGRCGTSSGSPRRRPAACGPRAAGRRRAARPLATPSATSASTSSSRRRRSSQ